MGDTGPGALKGGKLRTVEALSTSCRQQRFGARVGCLGRVWAAVQGPAGPVVWPESGGGCTGYSPHLRVVREAGLASEGAAGLVWEDVAGLTPVSRRAADVIPPENCPTDSVPAARGARHARGSAEGKTWAARPQGIRVGQCGGTPRARPPCPGLPQQGERCPPDLYPPGTSEGGLIWKPGLCRCDSPG